MHTGDAKFDFFFHVQVVGTSPSDCWNWDGDTNNYGYGRLSVDGNRMLAHRYSYLLFKGDIPDGLVIDHLCRNRKCVNPSHLEVVTISTNVKRGERATKTHCIRGHELSGNNLRIRKNGTRFCRACDRQRARYTRKVVSK